MNLKPGCSALIVTMMLLIAMVMPATACAPIRTGTSTIDGSNLLDEFNIETEEGLGQLSGLLQVTLNEDARRAIKDLREKEYNLQYNQINVQRVSPKENKNDEIVIIEIPANTENNDTVGKFIFISHGNKTTVGNTITEYGEDYIKTEVFETTNGMDKNSVIENNAGIFSIDGEVIGDGVIKSSSSDSYIECDTCYEAYDFIYGSGCTLTAFATCGMFCLMATGPAVVVCGAVCAVVFYAFCESGSSNSVDYICSEFCD